MTYKWLDEARRNIGVVEIKGVKHNNVILGWLNKLNAWWHDDETPWCGVFVAHCFQTAGIPVPKFWMRASDWLNWGRPLTAPLYGCVVVFERKGGGHVGFVVGKDGLGNILVLGGNQGDAVNVKAFPASRVTGYRFPEGVAINAALLPVSNDVELSKTEA